MHVIRSHDALFRFVFGEPEQMGELLRGSLPPAVVAAIDWSSLRQVDGTFVDAELQERHADLLFEARLGNRPLLLYVLVEHKSGDDPLTALQLLRYIMRVWDRCLQRDPRARSLPAVLPFVVHHGDAPWRAARSVRALVDLEGIAPDVATFVRALQPELVFLLGRGRVRGRIRRGNRRDAQDPSPVDEALWRPVRRHRSTGRNRFGCRPLHLDRAVRVSAFPRTGVRALHLTGVRRRLRDRGVAPLAPSFRLRMMSGE